MQGVLTQAYRNSLLKIPITQINPVFGTNAVCIFDDAPLFDLWEGKFCGSPAFTRFFFKEIFFFNAAFGSVRVENLRFQLQ
jgi:hypothetical protein